MLNSSGWSHFFNGVLVGGINPNLEGYGGESCLNYTSLNRRFIETVFACLLSALAILFGRYLQQNAIDDDQSSQHSLDHNEPFRAVLFFAYTLVNGIELCYKFVNRQLIFVFNYCHILSYVHLYLIAAVGIRSLHKSSRKLLTITIYTMFAPIGAFVFPATDVRTQPFEYTSYYAHHILLLSTPIYLCHQYGRKKPTEGLFNLSWLLYSYAAWFLYNFVVAQGISVYYQANVNVMLCPISGILGFGENYRLHQFYWNALYMVVASIIYTSAVWSSVLLCKVFCSFKPASQFNEKID